jgi:DNA mismatch repair protein MutS
MARATPMRRQYLQMKSQYPDAILFFRLGDFYETFDEDAEVVAQVCDITLTSRPVAKGQRVPLAGVPYHAADSYIAKLLAAGHKVAIAEQMGSGTDRLRRATMAGPGEKPVAGASVGAGRGNLVPRQVIRVVTPGTIVEPSLLEEKRNNYLAALVVDGRRAGLAYIDITTGEFATIQFDENGLWPDVEQEMARLQPAEVIVPEQRGEARAGAEKHGRDSDGPRGSPELSQPMSLLSTSFRLTPVDSWRFELGNAQRALLEHFRVATLDGFGCEGKPLAVRAAGAIVQYLALTQPAALTQIRNLSTHAVGEYMVLDTVTRRNLELSQAIRTGQVQGSLLWVLDSAVTAMGGRLLRRWINQPLLDLERLRRRQEAVSAFVEDTPSRLDVRQLLRGLGDLERLTGRVVQSAARPRDLAGIRRTLEAIPELRQMLSDMKAREGPIAELASHLDLCAEIGRLLSEAIADEPPAMLASGGVIRSGYSAELDRVYAAAREAKEWVAELQRRERQQTGIQSLKVGYNKVFGYYLEVSKANLERVPPEYIRKQTLVAAERFFTPELKEQESLILNAEERQLELESRIFYTVCAQVAAAAQRLLRTAGVLATVDVYAALAEVALRNNYTRPELIAGDEIDIIAGRHPVVELTQRQEPFVPNDLHLSSAEAQIIVLTGPNMSGKSTILRQAALIVLMAQIGSYVPADRATIGLVDRIFTRIGAQDEIAAGRSTFMVEMVETANILNHATPRSLLVIDEVGRGTSTYDGISIAWAVVEYIHNSPRVQAKTLFATHYHELTELAELLPRVRNYNVAVSEQGDGVVFLYTLVPGGADRSYGIHVGQLAGLPRPVIHRAEEILSKLEAEARSPISPKRIAETRQLPLFMTSSPVLEELEKLDVESLTPLEAITKLYELQRRLE